MVAPSDIDGLPPADLKDSLLKLPDENAERRRVIAELREEIGRQLRVIRSPQGQREIFRCPAPFDASPLRRPRSV